MIMRRVEVLRGDEWVVIRMHEAVNGDLIRMFEDDGEQCVDKDGNTEFYVQGEPFVHPEYPDTTAVTCVGKNEIDSFVSDGGTVDEAFEQIADGNTIDGGTV